MATKANTLAAGGDSAVVLKQKIPFTGQRDDTPFQQGTDKKIFFMDSYSPGEFKQSVDDAIVIDNRTPHDLPRNGSPEDICAGRKEPLYGNVVTCKLVLNKGF